METFSKGNWIESLARLAYNKGTALIRGIDPLQRSAVATFSSTIPTSSLTCSTWLRWGQRQTASHTETEKLTDTETQGCRKHWPRVSRSHAFECFLNFYFKSVREDRRPEPKVWWNGETGHFKCCIWGKTIFQSDKRETVENRINQKAATISRHIFNWSFDRVLEQMRRIKAHLHKKALSMSCIQISSSS